jgi:hypothetical protein
MHGSIRIATSSTAGTTFEIRLPGKAVTDRRIVEPRRSGTAYDVEYLSVPTDASA